MNIKYKGYTIKYEYGFYYVTGTGLGIGIPCTSMYNAKKEIDYLIELINL